MEDVAVLGVGMYPFGVHTGVSTRDMAYVAGRAALDDAGVRFDQVGDVYVGYGNGPHMTGVRVVKEFGLTGVPVQRVENASATGSAALREAVRAVAGGHADIALALAWEHVEDVTLPGMSGRSVDDVLLPAAYFAMWTRRRMYERGTTPETLAAIAAKNWNHAATNPMAQRRIDHCMTVDEILASRIIADPLTAKMCAAVGSGAAAVVVGRPDFASRLRPERHVVRVAASVLRSETWEPGHVFLGPVIGPPTMTRATAAAAYEAAGIGPDDIDLLQVHDAFPVEELLYHELLGFCADGEADKLVHEGATTIGGRIPTSTDGGLIGRGHPGGPTGLAQVWETTVQLRGEAGARQVEGARTGLCHMVGAGSVCAVHILTTA